jgi:hypothetical protein
MFEHQARTGGGNDQAPPPNAYQHGLSLSYASFIIFMQLSQPEGMKLLRLRPKRPRLDLCAMQGIKTLPCKNLPVRE